MTIIILARRWFDKINGNTYHSVKVYVDNNLIGEIPFSYGYGEGYLQTALKILQDTKRFQKTDRRLASGMDEDTYLFMQELREHKDRFVIDVVDVQRKRDLTD